MKAGRVWAVLFLLALSSVNVATAAVVVRDVRIWAGADGTRLVFDLSGAPDYRVETLSDPARVVIDLGDASFPPRPLPARQGFFEQLRASQQPGNKLRLVIELNAAAQARAFVVTPDASRGHRLVLDLKPPATPGAAVAAEAVKSTTPGEPTGPVPASTRSVVTTDKGRDVIVAIDAGHGGVDPGAIGQRGVREKDVTLAIARRLKERIDKVPGMRAVLTRDTDVFLPLRDRIRRARVQQADMFVSVHADSHRDRSIAGSSVYVLSARGASDEAARWLAERENAADLVGGVSLDDKDGVLASVLLDLSQGASMSASIEAAGQVLRELDRIGNVRRPAVQHAGFVVLKSPDIPSMLVETAFISNPNEERKLDTDNHQQKLADAIQAGVLKYFQDNPPPGTRFALERSRPGLMLAGGSATGATN
ncbi:MAG: N-acetylmuramoyl-L-alanine amidase [Steroidobacteraceae bacterium]